MPTSAPANLTRQGLFENAVYVNAALMVREVCTPSPCTRSLRD